jgi:hypothetical protein
LSERLDRIVDEFKELK